jgi:hypothetical protein
MNFKKIMILLLGLMLIGTLVVQAQEPAVTVSTITVQGNSQMTVIPDQAVVTISVINTAPTANEAQATNAKSAIAVQQQLLAMGIAKDNLRTTQYGIYPLYSENDKAGKAPSIIGYQVTNTLMATLDDVTTIGNVIDTALASGANQISGVHFQKKEELQLKQAALQGAVQEATAKAEAIAVALNKTLGKVIAVNESGVSVQAPEMQRYLLKSDAVGTSLLPGSIQVNGSVTIIFEIR